MPSSSDAWHWLLSLSLKRSCRSSRSMQAVYKPQGLAQDADRSGTSPEWMVELFRTAAFPQVHLVDHIPWRKTGAAHLLPPLASSCREQTKTKPLHRIYGAIEMSHRPSHLALDLIKAVQCVIEIDPPARKPTGQGMSPLPTAIERVCVTMCTVLNSEHGLHYCQVFITA